MNYTNKTIKHHFTLLEVIIAMAIFTVLSLVVFQFFAGAQRLWADAERKHAMYGDARTAMDLMSQMVQSMYYNDGETPFAVSNTSSNNDKIYFATRSEIGKRGTSDRFFVSFQRSTNDDSSLLLCTLCEGDAAFAGVFPPFTAGGNPAGDYDTARTQMTAALDTSAGTWTAGATASSLTAYEVIPHVVALRFRPFTFVYGNAPTAVSGASSSIPQAVEITFTVLSKPDFEHWKTLPGYSAPTPGTPASDSSDAQEFRLRRGMTFSRMVYIGNYGR